MILSVNCNVFKVLHSYKQDAVRNMDHTNWQFRIGRKTSAQCQVCTLYFHPMCTDMGGKLKRFFLPTLNLPGLACRKEWVNVHDFLDALEPSTADILPGCNEVIPTGDFNTDLLSVDNNKTIFFFTFIELFSLSQIINIPTRVTSKLPAKRPLEDEPSIKVEMEELKVATPQKTYAGPQQRRQVMFSEEQPGT
ncbi:hypothetical protein ILUMI_07450 [Ignelater luminosus]|uniref:Uncharacterized protein n=1 Tax=Ignelater luminosus TaxID=2038154 RepID=A0A8K0GI19_IGNLU|nr:hypothetical protein ILUMI_07450 [Ignelater luminosus]